LKKGLGSLRSFPKFAQGNYTRRGCVCVLTVSCSTHTHVHVEISPSPVQKRSLCSCQFASSPTHSSALALHEAKTKYEKHCGSRGKKAAGGWLAEGCSSQGLQTSLIVSRSFCRCTQRARAHPPECGLLAGGGGRILRLRLRRLALQNAPPPCVDNLPAP